MDYSTIAFIWLKDKKIGYCHTHKEADDICKKKTAYSWCSGKINEDLKKKLKFMTITDYELNNFK